MVKFKLKGTIVKTVTLNEKNFETSQRTFFVSKRYRVLTDRSRVAIINQIKGEYPEFEKNGEKVIYISGIENCDKFYKMEEVEFLAHATECEATYNLPLLSEE